MALLSLAVPHWHMADPLTAGLLAVPALPTAALLGAALGLIRPIRKSLVPRSSHVIQTQVLLAIVGAVIMLVVAESLARAFAIWRTQSADTTARAIVLRSAREGFSAVQVTFNSSSAPAPLRPQLRISYTPRIPLGLP